jgi:hypothetical protein
MARPISFEKILEQLKELNERIGIASGICLDKRYASDDDDEKVLLKHQEMKYDHISEQLYDIIAEIEGWVQV